MSRESVHRTWLVPAVVICVAGLLVAACGQADREVSGAATGTSKTTTTTDPVVQPRITLPAQVGDDLVSSKASLVEVATVVDQVGPATAAVSGAGGPVVARSAGDALGAVTVSLRRYVTILAEVDDGDLERLLALLEDLTAAIDDLTAEMAAGRADLDRAVSTVETALDDWQRAWSAQAADWEAAWERADHEWKADWQQAAADWEAQWQRTATEWEAQREQAGSEWEAQWERAAEDWRRAWEDVRAEIDGP